MAMESEVLQPPAKRACRTSVSASPSPEDDSDLYGTSASNEVTEPEQLPQLSATTEKTHAHVPPTAVIPGLGSTSQQHHPEPAAQDAVPAHDQTELHEGHSNSLNDSGDIASAHQVSEPSANDSEVKQEVVKSEQNFAAENGASEAQTQKARTDTSTAASAVDGENNFLLDAVGESLKQEGEGGASMDSAMIDAQPVSALSTAGNVQLAVAAQVDGNAQGEGAAEWEVDSSPYESSDSSDSDDTSSDDSDDDEEDPDYAMLDPEEQARILMQGDGGSDDEGPSKGGKGGGGHLRTANEKPEEVIPKPDIVVTPDMTIQELGSVEAAVESTVLVMGKTSGEYRVLETGSVLCLQDRTVVGVVAETLGRVQQPLYTVRFTNDAAIQEAGLAEKGTPIYYVEKHSTFVFTQPLKAVKGSDASNVNDEEVGDDEMEFSDDEAEAEHKRQLKNMRQNRRDARNGANGSQKSWSRDERSSYPINNSASMYDDTPEINYDDVDSKGDDGYTPLVRPTNLPELMSRREPTTEGWQTSATNSNVSARRDRGRGRGANHHRGNRGRGRGDGGRGSGRDRRNDYPARVHEQRGQQGPFNPQHHHSMGPPSWPQQPPKSTPTSFSGYQQPPNPYMYQGPHIQPPQPPQMPQPPSLSPQNSQHVPFTPSPISPLPSQQFQWPPAHQPPPQSPQQHLAVPPPGSHINPTFYNQGQPQFSGQQGYGGNSNNNAAFAQVQAQLDMLRRYGTNPR